MNYKDGKPAVFERWCPLILFLFLGLAVWCAIGLLVWWLL